MKPHIELTLADLRASRTKLDDLITTLEGFGASMDGDPTPTPAATANHTAILAGAQVQREIAPRRGRPRGRPRAAVARVDAPAGKSDNRSAVKSIMAAASEPFTQEDIRTLLQNQRKDLTAKQVNDLVRNTVHSLVNAGELGELGEGRPSKYKRRHKFTAPGAVTSGAEDRYREFRSTVPTSTPESE